MKTMIKEGKMISLYSYNQMAAIWGNDDKQVMAIFDYIFSVGDVSSNYSVEAFSRIEV